MWSSEATREGHVEMERDLWSDIERNALMQLPRNLDFSLAVKDAKKRCRIRLIVLEILLAYAYDLRITDGEHNIESAWTLCMLSPTLSWFDDSAKDAMNALVAFIRRSITFPLYRSLALAFACVEDVLSYFLNDSAMELHPSIQVRITKCLLNVRQLLLMHESRCRLVHLYLDDLCVYVQINLCASEIVLLARDTRRAWSRIASEINEQLGLFGGCSLTKVFFLRPKAHPNKPFGVDLSDL